MLKIYSIYRISLSITYLPSPTRWTMLQISTTTWGNCGSSNVLAHVGVGTSGALVENIAADFSVLHLVVVIKRHLEHSQILHHMRHEFPSILSTDVSGGICDAQLRLVSVRKRSRRYLRNPTKPRKFVLPNFYHGFGFTRAFAPDIIKGRDGYGSIFLHGFEKRVAYPAEPDCGRRVPWIIFAAQCVCILEKHAAGNPHAR
jgi:hypothetical protein